MMTNDTAIALANGIFKLRETLEEVKQCCIYSDENCPGGVGVTDHPNIDSHLFNKILRVLKETEGL